MAYTADVIKYKGKNVVQLKAGRYSAIIAPFLGSNILSMEDEENDISFFRKDESLSIEELQASPEVYGFPTLFYPNRLRDGILKTSDGKYYFPVVVKDENTSLHGFLHKREHSIVDARVVGDSAVARTEYVYDSKDPFFESFPVSFKAEFTFKLSDEGMRPFVNGAEPLNTRLFVTIGDKWPLNQRNLPTCDFISLDNHDRQYLTGSMIPVKHVINNDVYNCETYDVDGLPFRGAIMSDVATGKEIIYEVDDNFKFWVLWNDGGEKGYFCPEPSTWMIDAPNLPLPKEESGYEELAPGMSKTVRERIFSLKK